jgi:sulfur carrier protein ThiS
MKIHLGGYLSFYHADKKSALEVQIDGPAKLVDLLRELDFPLQEIQLVAVNGEQVALDKAVISEGDEVKLFSAVGGG